MDETKLEYDDIEFGDDIFKKYADNTEKQLELIKKISNVFNIDIDEYNKNNGKKIFDRFNSTNKIVVVEQRNDELYYFKTNIKWQKKENTIVIKLQKLDDNQ